jgi:hypothetical protein
LTDLVRIVYNKISNNQYALFDRMIDHIKVILAKDGLDSLELLLRGDIYSLSEGLNRDGTVLLLKQIADAQGDVDKFIDITREFPCSNINYDKLQCAMRLANSSRVLPV